MVRQHLEASLLMQAAEEPAQELRPVVTGLVRDGFLRGRVPVVVEAQQYFEHLQRGRSPDRVARKHFDNRRKTVLAQQTSRLELFCRAGS